MKIDPTQPLTHEDFCELFEQVPLNEREREDVKTVYWGIYSVLIKEVESTEAWVAVRNMFAINEAQIKERM
jgi:hypothetical protein